MIDDFEFQMQIWGFADLGYDPLAVVWESRRSRDDLDGFGHHIWDKNAEYLNNFWINDERAPTWHCLHYVARRHLEQLNE